MELQRRWRLGVKNILMLALLTVTAGFSVLAMLPAGTASAAQTIPYKVNFQGRLTDNNGNILADGLYNIKFRFWDALSGGTNKYEEDRIITGTDNRIQVTSGLFNIQFGDVTALTTALFSGAFPLYLEVELPTPATATCATNACAVFTEGAMTPRQPLASSPYAFNADTLDGVDSTAFSQLSGTNTFTGTNTFQPTTNIPSVLIKQNSSGSFGQDVFNVSGSSSGNFIQVTSTAANQGAVTVQSLGANALTLQSGSGTISLGSTTLVNSTGTLAINSGAATILALDSGTTGAINIGGGTAGNPAKTISLGPTATNTSATTYQIGVNTAGTQAISIGSAGSNNAAAGTTINIQAGTTANTAVTIGTNGAGGVTVGTGTTGAINIDSGTTGSILVGGGTGSAKTISIGPTATNTNTTTYNLGVNTAGTQTIKIGSSAAGGAAAGTTVNIQGGTTASTAVTLGTNGAGGITIDTGTTGSILIGNGANAKATTIGSTNTTSTTFIQGGTTGSVGIGSVGSSTLASTVNVANTTDGTAIQIVSIGSNANASNTVDIDGGTAATSIEIGDTTTAHGIKIGAGGAAAGNSQTVAVGSGTTTTASTVTLQGGNITTTNGNSGIIIGGGYSNSDTNLVGLTLDSSTTFAETANTCTGTVNGGTLYYNATSNAIRGCVNGNWEDVITTSGLGIITFGVVPDSGSNPGDLAALQTTGVSGPCRVSWASTTTYSIAPCTAYSDGRKVIVAQQTGVAVSGMTATSVWAHICLTGANGQPALSATATTENATGNQPTWSANNPVLCLADILGTGAGQNISKIYDTRTFTNTQKDFVTIAGTTPGLGQLVVVSTSSVTQSGATVTLTTVVGVLVALSSAGASTRVPSGIIATAGPQYVKATTTTSGQFLQSTTTAGYATSVAAYSGTASYGQVRTSATNTCAAAATCLDSAYVNFKSH